MPIIQLVFSLILLGTFLFVLLFVACYVAIPLLLLWFLWTGGRVLTAWIQGLRAERQANGCRLRPTPFFHRRHRQTTVIDVDYREVK